MRTNSTYRASRMLAVIAVATVVVGCANVKIDVPGATPTTQEKLRASRIAPTNVGRFVLAPGKEPEMDKTLNSGLRGNSVTPAKGSFALLLKDTLVTELTAAGLYDDKSAYVIEGQLTDSRVDAAVGTGTARLSARFTVARAGQQVFDKELAVDSTWESSFMGAVAIPRAINEYGALYKTLVARLVEDPDFRTALAR